MVGFGSQTYPTMCNNIEALQGWKGSVKAQHFVLQLHDFYVNKTSSHVKVRAPPIRADTVPNFSSSMPLTKQERRTAVNSVKQTDDKWTLSYINVYYLQPIREAIDDDETGFITIQEVNFFATSKPQNWTYVLFDSLLTSRLQPLIP